MTYTVILTPAELAIRRAEILHNTAGALNLAGDSGSANYMGIHFDYTYSRGALGQSCNGGVLMVTVRDKPWFVTEATIREHLDRLLRP